MIRAIAWAILKNNKERAHTMNKQKEKWTLNQITKMMHGLEFELADAMDDIASIIQRHDIPECAGHMIKSALAKLANANFTIKCIKMDL